MKLDVVVPTYNRSHLLQLTVASLLQAPVPEGLEVTVIVVDNNSKDDTKQVVEAIQATASRPVVYVKETEQGSSQSRNAGIRAGKGEIIGFIDDDEEIDEQWYAVVAREFADPATQLIGGPYLPNCSVPMPEWLPPGYNGVIGVVPPKPREAFSPSFPGNLQGGNAVLRRTVFERLGGYSLKLGRTDKGLQSEEDAEFYRRILDAGLLGYHVPDLIIYHYIPESRLTRSYHRSWCYWRGGVAGGGGCGAEGAGGVPVGDTAVPDRERGQGAAGGGEGAVFYERVGAGVRAGAGALGSGGVRAREILQAWLEGWTRHLADVDLSGEGREPGAVGDGRELGWAVAGLFIER